MIKEVIFEEASDKDSLNDLTRDLELGQVAIEPRVINENGKLAK